MDLKLAEEYFNISDKEAEHPIFSASATEMLSNRETMLEFLRLGAEAVKGIGFDLALSNAGLSFFGLAATKQYVMSIYDRILDLSPGNLTIQLEKHEDHVHILFKVGEWRWTDLPAEGRDEAILGVWNDYFATTMNPLIETAAATVDLRPDLVWSQYGTRMLYMLDYARKLLPPGAVTQRFEDDYALLCTLPASTFNRRKMNPYVHTPRFLENPVNPEEKWMIRSACCMYYRQEDGVKCYTCPILKESDREVRKQEMLDRHALQQASG